MESNCKWSNLRDLRELLLQCSSKVPFGCIGILCIESFYKFCKFLFVSKIIFQFLSMDVGFTLNHVKLLCPFSLHLFALHLYFSRSGSHSNTSNCSTTRFCTRQISRLRVSVNITKPLTKIIMLETMKEHEDT